VIPPLPSGLHLHRRDGLNFLVLAEKGYSTYIIIFINIIFYFYYINSSNLCSSGLTINTFYGASSATETTVTDAVDEGEDDVVSAIKRRRQNATKLAEEKRVKDEERRVLYAWIFLIL